MRVYPLLYKHVFSALDPEAMHKSALGLLKAASRSLLIRSAVSSIYSIADERLGVEVFGLKFPNPLGLASGFDKDAKAVVGLASLGFAFIEVGTVTPLPQKGNPKPRVFRLREDRAIINRIGFANAGCAGVCTNLRMVKRSSEIIVASSLGKGQQTDLEEALGDYLDCMRVLYPYSDFFVINVSSPNTPGLRMLQRKAFLKDIATEMVACGGRSARELGCEERPLLVKISPDVGPAELDGILELAVACGISGIVATNTTVRRERLMSHHRSEVGGLSGSPLGPISTELIRLIYGRMGGKLPIIGVGGIFTAMDALEKLAAGASLLQAYTGFVYQGPSFARDINRGLLDVMDSRGIRSLHDLIGNADILEDARSRLPG